MVIKHFLNYLRGLYRSFSEMATILRQDDSLYKDSNHIELIRLGDFVVAIKNLDEDTDFVVPTNERTGKIAFDSKTRTHYWVFKEFHQGGEVFYEMRELRTFTRCDGPLPATASFSQK